MMKTKILTLLLASMLLAMTAPPASASTVVREYDLAFGTATTGGSADTYDPALSWPICGVGSEWEPCVVYSTATGDEALDIGVGSFEADGGSVYTQATVTASDDNFDTTFMAGCVRTGEEDAENFCTVHTEGCGSIVVAPGYLFGADDRDSGEWDKRLGVFIYTTNLDLDTFETCAGSSGSVTAVFS